MKPWTHNTRKHLRNLKLGQRKDNCKVLVLELEN